MNQEEMERNIKREYFKKWRAKNRDRIKESNKRYWKKKVIKKLQGDDYNE